MKSQGPRVKGGGQSQGPMPTDFMQNKNYFLRNIKFYFIFVIFLGKYPILCYIWFTRASEMIF